MPLSPGESIRQPEHLELSDQDWYFVTEEDFALVFDAADEVGVADFVEANREEEQDNGYVYNVKDFVQARNGWLW